jgi:hypothetical protein
MPPAPGPPLSPSLIPSFAHPEHGVQFYSDDEVLLDGIATHLRGAIESGNGAICIATRKHLAALADRPRMREEGMSAAIKQGRYLLLEVEDFLNTIMSEGNFDSARASELSESMIATTTAAIERENPRVVVFGETVASLWAERKFDAVLRLEQLWNNLAHANHVSVLCGYPIQAFITPRDDAYFRMICGEHSTVVVPEDYPVQADEPEQSQAAMLPEELLARERSLLARDARVDYPDWQGQYQAAVLETDRHRLFKSVEVAEAAVLTRLHELQTESDHHAELHQLMRAWRVLQIIKRDQLGFLE